MTAVGGSYVWVPEAFPEQSPLPLSGAAAYPFWARSPTTVRFEFDVAGSDGWSDSFFLQIDDGPKHALHTQSLQPRFEWVSQRSGHGSGSGSKALAPASYAVAKGAHTLRVTGREDGAMLRAISIASGDAMFAIPGALWPL